MDPQFDDYKQLRSGNKYSPLDTPRLTTGEELYRTRTALHTSYWKSAAFGYPARRHKLGIRQKKQTTKTPSFLVPAKLLERYDSSQPVDPRITRWTFSEGIAKKYPNNFRKDSKGEYRHISFF